MTHHTEAELLPCRFCGSESVIMEPYKADGLRIICKNCAVKREQRTMRKSIDWLRAGMISDWNRRAPAAPAISEAQVLAITTAYEQGVGKGHQSHARKEAITNPYGDEWGCDSAWQMGYDEGREQAERKAAAHQPPDAFQTEGGLKSEIRTTSTAPVQMPEPFTTLVRKKSWSTNCYEAAPLANHRDYGRRWADERVEVYTEQQVRQLLADNGIGKDKA